MLAADPSDISDTEIVPDVKIPEDRTERLARELELGEALLRDERKRHEQALVDVHHSLASAQSRVAEIDRDAHVLLEHLTATRKRLAEIEASRTWRIARRLRDHLNQRPRLRAVLLRMLNLAYRIASPQLRGKPGEQQAPAASASPQPDTRVRKCEVAASGWLGGTSFEVDHFHAPDVVALADPAQRDELYREQTAKLVPAASDAARALATLRLVAPAGMIAEKFRGVRINPVTDDSARPTWRILTVVEAETKFLRQCAASVAALIEGLSDADSGRVEWLIVSDDPARGADTIAAMLPAGLRASVRIQHDGERRGMVARLNEARRDFTGSEWLLYLRGDDEIEPHALAVLDRYVARFPKCRYISACGADIDEAGVVLRWGRSGDPTHLFEDEESVGGLIAVRCDLLLGQPPYRPELSPCHDYDFALRVALREPLLCVPDYLYRSRRRTDRDGMLRQMCTAIVLRDFLGTLAAPLLPNVAHAIEGDGPSKLKSGLCLIRTQGKRLEFLEEAVLSVVEQTVPVTPCIIVHGDKATADEVRRHLSARSIAAIVIEAPDLDKRRGYPLNVGLDYLRQHADAYDFFFFLDDDDVLYPFFAARLAELLDLTSADVGVADANSRVPWEPATRNHNLKPAAALLAGNFMPIHSFIMRTRLLADTTLRFDEEIDYLEDWDFLISVFARVSVSTRDARFRFLPEALCEFRIIGDGSTPEKNRPIHYEFCRQQILARAAAIARRAGPGRYLRDLADFDFNERPGLTDYEKDHLLSTRELFFASASGSPK